MNLSGTVIGYDPGGNGCHGISRLMIENGEICDSTTDTFQTAEQVLNHVNSESSLIGLGVDTLTCWSTGKSGWRPADRWLRKKYVNVSNSVINPNFLSGSMSLNGMAVLYELRKRRPQLFITETHPKVLYWFLAQEKYDYENDRLSMDKTIQDCLNRYISPSNDHEWDALISAYAALQGLLGIWKNDLHHLPVINGERLITPCGITNYFWPE